MTTPSGSQSTYDVVVNFQTAHPEILDAAYEKTKDIVNIEERAKAVYKSVADEVKKLNPELYAQAQAAEKAAQAQEHLAKSQAQALTNIRLQIRDMRAQAKEIVANNRLLLDSAKDIDRIAKPLFTGGLLVTGGIFAAANKYVNNAKEATEVTKEWKAAQESLNQSGEKIGAVLAEQALPILKEAAKVTSQIAGFLQANPEVAGAALKGGLIAVTLGAIGKAVSGGIRLYADLKMDAALALQFEAAQLQVQASRMQLEAAGISASSGKYGAAGGLIGPAEKATVGGGLVAGLTSPLGVAALAVGAFTAASKFDDALKKLEVSLYKTGKTGETIAPVLDSFVRVVAGASSPILGIVTSFKRLKDELPGGIAALEKLLGVTGLVTSKSASSLGSASGSVSYLGGSQEIQDKVVADYEKFVNESAKITADGEAKRKGIIADSEREIVAITAKAAGARQQVNDTYAVSLRKSSSGYEEARKKIDQDEAKSRASILKDGSKQILKTEKDLQKQLAELEKEHSKNLAGFTADRDALALAKEDERYQDARDVAVDNANEQIRQERADLADRLKESASNFAEQRAQRFAQYKQELKDAAEKRAADLKAIAIKEAEEKKVALAAEKKKLDDLRLATINELKAKQAAFIASVRDLNDSLLGERGLKQKYYSAMLADASRFLTAYRASLPGSTGSTITATASGGTASGTSTSSGTASPTWSLANLFGTKDSGGYVDKGLYRMAWDGKREFVASGMSTRAAEQAIGGQLTQQNMAQAYQMLGASRGNVNYQDNSRYDASVNARTRRDMRNESKRDTVGLLEGLIR